MPNKSLLRAWWQCWISVYWILAFVLITTFQQDFVLTQITNNICIEMWMQERCSFFTCAMKFWTIAFSYFYFLEKCFYIFVISIPLSCFAVFGMAVTICIIWCLKNWNRSKHTFFFSVKKYSDSVNSFKDVINKALNSSHNILGRWIDCDNSFNAI